MARPSGAVARVQAGLVAGTGAGVLVTGVATGAGYGGLAGAGAGAGIGLVLGFPVAGLAHSTAEVLIEESASERQLVRRAMRAAALSGVLLLTGAVVGGQLAGPVGAGVGAVAGLVTGLATALFIGFMADTVVDFVTVGRGPARLLGIVAGGGAGTIIGLTFGRDLIAGCLLGMAAAAFLLEMGRVAWDRRLDRRAQRVLRVPQPAAADPTDLADPAEDPLAADGDLARYRQRLYRADRQRRGQAVAGTGAAGSPGRVAAATGSAGARGPRRR